MRVLQLIDSLNPGGAERVAVNFANSLSFDHSSFLCTTRKEGVLKKSINKSVDYLFLNRNKIIDVKAIIRLLKYVKKNKIEIIHAHSTSFFIATLIKIFHPKVKVAWHNHFGDNVNMAYKKKTILSFSSLFFSVIFCVNKALVIWSKEKLKCKLVAYIPNYSCLNTDLKITTLKGQDSKRILCLANLREEKDHITLINAFNTIYRERNDWSLHCVGKDFNDSYSKQVYDLVEKLKINKAIFFYGSKSDIGNIVKQCNIGVLSSKIEGLPLALLEYGMGELAVVATNVGDVSKVISHESLGTVIEPCNIFALKKAIMIYIDDIAKRDLVSKNLNRQVLENHSEDDVIKSIMSYYKIIK